ncbi:MAG: hypothetical protein ACXV2J_06420 [Actinomycetes bacterium]
MTSPTGYAGRTHTAALLAAVEAAWPRVSLVQVSGDRTLPYAVVYPLGSGLFDGSLTAGDEQADVWPLWQVTSVGAGAEQAEDLRDRIRAALLGQYLLVDGRKVGPIRLEDEQPVQLDTDVTPHVQYAVDRFRVYSTPSS